MATLSADQKGIQTVVNKAWDDSEFLNELIASPQEAIEKATGNPISLPEGVTLRVNDQTDANTYYINIPPKPDYSNMELSDEQLEQVAGGELAVTAVIGVTLGAAALGYTIGYNSDW